jgi:hypothetical protein
MVFTPKKNTIKTLYAQIDKKTMFIIEVADYFGKSPQSLRVHWFSSFWSIPEDYQDELIVLLELKIEEQCK